LGGIAGLATQYPAGELLLGLSISAVGLSALMMGLWPTYAAALIALFLQGTTGGFIKGRLADDT
jgi:hypothetical protein